MSYLITGIGIAFALFMTAFIILARKEAENIRAGKR